MGKHSEWRKIVKKQRRQRKRREAAQTRTKLEAEEQDRKEKSPSYQNWLKEQQQLEEFQAAEELRISKEQEALYQEREKADKEKWQALQKKLQNAKEARAIQNIKIKEEWEAEQKRLQVIKEEKTRQLEEQLLNEQRLQEQIDQFINNNGVMPDELNQIAETNPGKITCPFFSRTASCKFGDVCSRNHKKPTVSSILLMKNFYFHYSLDAKDNEHGDASLEFDTQEVYKHFEAFFNDVVPELENYGVVQQFKTCCNKEAHLRGNVYVEYSNTREAMRAYRRFQGRFYAGKQLNVEFCTIQSWKSAICGLFYRNRCPKGSMCNFLHAFLNPGNMFTKLDFKRETRRDAEAKVAKQSKVDDCTDWNGSERSDWRWSSSPEIPMVEVECDSKSDKNENISRSPKEKRRASSMRDDSHRRSGSRTSGSSKHRRSRSSHRTRSTERSMSRKTGTKTGTKHKHKSKSRK